MFSYQIKGNEGSKNRKYFWWGNLWWREVRLEGMEDIWIDAKTCVCVCVCVDGWNVLGLGRL